MPRNPGRTGRAWRRARAQCLTQGKPCAWCGKPIDLRVSYPHPMSPTVDHITPLSMGGSPLDPANHQPMHKVCNERKSLHLRNRPKRTSRLW